MTLLILGGRSLIGVELIRLASSRGESFRSLGRKNMGDNYIYCDLRERESILTALSHPEIADVTRIIFCHRYRPSPFEQSDLNDEMTIMVTGPMYLSQCAYEMFTNLSNILFIGSPAAEYVSVEQPPEYHLSRSALESMSRCLAFSFGEKNIAVNTIRLGYVKNVLSPSKYSHDYYQMDKYAVPRGYGASPLEIATTIDNLSCMSTGLLTGQTITLDAGLSLRSHSSLAEHLRITLRDDGY